MSWVGHWGVSANSIDEQGVGMAFLNEFQYFRRLGHD